MIDFYGRACRFVICGGRSVVFFAERSWVSSELLNRQPQNMDGTACMNESTLVKGKEGTARRLGCHRWHRGRAAARKALAKAWGEIGATYTGHEDGIAQFTIKSSKDVDVPAYKESKGRARPHDVAANYSNWRGRRYRCSPTPEPTKRSSKGDTPQNVLKRFKRTGCSWAKLAAALL